MSKAASNKGKNEADIYEQQIVDKLWDSYGLTRTTAAAVAQRHRRPPWRRQTGV